MAAMDPVKNRSGQVDRAVRQQQARREDRSAQVRATARSRRGI